MRTRMISDNMAMLDKIAAALMQYETIGEKQFAALFEQEAGEVLRQLLLRGVEKLKNLFRGNRSRSEVVATFLSILELCKTGSVILEGDISGENPEVRLIKTDKEEGGNVNGTE